MIRTKGLITCMPLLAILVAGCRMPEAPGADVLLSGDRGTVYLYLQALPQEAERIIFDLDAAAALAEDGAELPLALSLTRIEPGEGKRQRFLASGILPAGAYRGFSFKASKAWLKTEDGSAALLADERPATAEFPFVIHAGRATTVHAQFLSQKSVPDGFSFSPVFSLSQAGRQVAGLIGYVSNTKDDTITVFDKKAGKVLSVIATGRQPKGIVFDHLRNRAYVALSGDDAVGAIDMTTGELLTTIHLHVGAAPRDLALTSDGRMLLSANPGSNSVSFIDTTSFVELSTLSVGDGPAAILLPPVAGRRVYVFNRESDSISVIDVTARAVAATTGTPTGPLRGQFDRKNERLYLVYGGSPYLTIMDPATMALTGQVFIREPAGALKVDAMTDMIYVGGAARGEVAVYDPLSLFLVDAIPASDGVSYLTIDGQENSLLMLSPEARTLTSVNINTRTSTYVIDVGRGAYQVSVMGER